jgi:hypothetical protein
MLVQYSIVHALHASHGDSMYSIGYLRYVYELLLHETGIDLRQLEYCATAETGLSICEQACAYNLIITQDYMFVVPRSQLARDGEAVNSMGRSIAHAVFMRWRHVEYCVDRLLGVALGH